MPSTKKAPSETDEPIGELVRRANRTTIHAAFRWFLKSSSANPLTAHQLGALHERLLDEVNGGRRRTGAYYTPPELVRVLLDRALEPVLATRVSAALGRAVQSPSELRRLSPNEKNAAAEALLSTAILDPACGSGVFLEATAERLCQWLRGADKAHGSAVGGSVGLKSTTTLRQIIAERCLFGIDADETAVLLARHVTGAGGHIHRGDALLDPPPWPGRKFDAVLGNPPFANAIEGLVAADVKKRLAKRWPELRGTADLAFYFLAAAHELAASNGAVGLVLPRSVLSAPAAGKLRQRLRAERPPSFLFAPDDPLIFPGANVFVTLVVLRNADGCIVGGANGVSRRVAIDSENWWRDIHVEADANDSPRLVDVFELHASMTAGQAYSLLPFLAESTSGEDLRFVTTGLIDPSVCLWGEKVCRYLGRRFQRPTIRVDELPDDLARRVARMRRPKVVVAGLSTRVEAFLDEKGGHIGAVSTYSIVHPKNEVNALRRLCDRLNRDESAGRLRNELGATALGGGRITLTKLFLRGFPLGADW